LASSNSATNGSLVVARVDDVRRREAVEAPPRELLDAGAHVRARQLEVGVRLAHLETGE
jgi:hypothetical protein